MSAPKTDIFRDRDLTAKGSADVNKIMSELLDSHEQLEAEAERLREALMRIERWFGEFPETGKFWRGDEGAITDRPMSYGAAYGSNGERDYMRSIARAALEPK